MLPLGRRSLRKLERILRQEMEAADAQEFLLPSLHPAEPWQSSGRWDAIDATMFRLQDRRGGDYCLAMTHEEIFTGIARSELRSYRQLPQRWYQIGLKFRDEPRPKSGLLRVREFHMKDAYSFDLDSAGLDAAFERMRVAYERIYARCGVDAVPAEAFSGAMGGRESIEFMVRTSAGEDQVIRCAACDYTANAEVARSLLAPYPGEPTEAGEAPQVFPTPGVLTIDALAAPPHRIPAERQLKTLVYMADNRPVIAVLRGDHALNEAKLQLASGSTGVRPAQPDEVVDLMGAHPGSLGAVGFDAALVLVDSSVADRVEMVTGANRDGFHLRGVSVQRDVLTGEHARVVDLRMVGPGESCPNCGAPLESFSALEVGHIFKLGTRYSERMGAYVLTADGRAVPLVMGSYGIGLERLLAAVVEAHHDDDGIIWPAALSPYDVEVVTLGGEPELAALADTAIAYLLAAGLDVLYDDRAERPGVKFKDADLIGIPLRIGIGKRALATNSVELKKRSNSTAELVPLAELAGCLRE
jgi:prolyl-tRNA synthetase